MSFTQPEAAIARLHRSELAVPGATPVLFEKAARSAADVVFLDLEDAVAVGDKEKARDYVIKGLNEVDWGNKGMSVRINGADTHYMYRDVVDIVENCPRLDMIIMPKVGVAADIYALDMLVTQIEQARGRSKKIGLVALIETALGLANVEAIAQSSKRLEAMYFGAGDLAASLRMRTTSIGGLHPDHGVLSDADASGQRTYTQTDPWHAAQSRVVVACRAYGLRPLDGAFGDIKDAAGFLAATQRAAAMGFAGRMVIHPSQIAPSNQAFSPGEKEVADARRVLAVMEQAAREKRGAVQIDGRLIDMANLRMAQNIVWMADAIAAAR
ncbi:MAG TPA: CoA ester lyase [Burkholderiales bacterium]|nr:CoA ester lyase [Burkholderiales bacterium]